MQPALLSLSLLAHTLAPSSPPAPAPQVQPRQVASTGRESGTLRVCAWADLSGSGTVRPSGYAEVTLTSSLDARGHGFHGHGSVSLWKQFYVVSGRVWDWVYPYSDHIWLYDSDGRYVGSVQLHGEITVSGEVAPGSGSMLRLRGPGELCADIYVAP